MIEDWVYSNLERYRNCALSYKYNKYSIEEMEKLFPRCKVRVARYCYAGLETKNTAKYKNYYILELKKRYKYAR